MSSLSSLTISPHRRSGLIALGLATGLTLSSLVAAGPATAIKPSGSRAEVMLTTGASDGSLDPDDAITAGWWGHEGGAHNGTGTGTTYLSLNGADSTRTVTDQSIAALLAAMGTDDFGNIAYAIVPTSADGSSETPSVTAGENAADAFADGWVMSASWDAALNGSAQPNDSVITVSKANQLTAWVAAGKPLQSFDSSLVLHDVSDPATPVSAAPRGTSILNTWPVGTHLSLVAYVSDGFDTSSAYAGSVAKVKAGPGGKAMTAWVPFTTVAKPGDPLRSSAGYVMAGPAQTSLSVTSSLVGDTATLAATVKKPDGTQATDATGTIVFTEVVTAGSTPPPTEVAASNGTASLTVPLPAGATKVFDVTYVPDAPAQAGYLAPASATRRTVTHEVTQPPAAQSTTTSLTVTGTLPGTAALKAAVSPAATGTVTFSDGTATLGQASVIGGSATLTATLAQGQHAIKASFAPADAAGFKASSSAVATVWTPGITTTVKPAKLVAGKNGKLTITLATPGTTASGQLVVTIKPPKGGKAKTVTVGLKGGRATVKLAKLVKGKTKVTIAYAGSGNVLGATATASVKAAPAKKTKK
jgi:hypothetical protein